MDQRAPARRDRPEARSSSATGATPHEGHRRVDAGSVFAVVWALANAVHLLNQTGGHMPVVSWVNFAAVLWVLGRPSSAHRLAVLAAAQLLDTLWLSPFTPDHQVLAAVVNLAILGTYAVRRRPSSSRTLVTAAAPAARLVVLVAYVASAIAKYNTDFLTVDRSCAVDLAEAASFGLLDRTAATAVVPVAGTLLAESLVPLLLLVPRTRRWGVLVGCTFHFLVSLSPAMGVADFTTTLMALFLLFLPPRDIEELGRRALAEWRGTRVVVALDRVRRPAIALVVIGAVALASRADVIVHATLWLVVTFTGVWFLVTLLLILRAEHAAPQPLGPFRLAHVALVGAVVFLVAGPYLGLGTSSRFTMFSGLRTEGPGTNHLFLPSVHVVDSQNQAFVVRATAGDAPEALRLAAEQRAAMPVVELRRWLQDPDVGATLESPDGPEVVVVRPGVDHALRAPPAVWESRTQHYRTYAVPDVTATDFCSN